MAAKSVIAHLEIDLEIPAENVGATTGADVVAYLGTLTYQADSTKPDGATVDVSSSTLAGVKS